MVASSALYQYLLVNLTLTNPNKWLNIRFKAYKVDQGVENVIKIDNRNIKNKIVEIKVSSKQRHVHRTPKKPLKKVLDMLQVVNKETQSVVFNKFHILF